MPVNIHSTYNITSGTSSVTSLTIPSVEVPSVVDGMLIFVLHTGSTVLIDSGSSGIQNPTLLRSDSVGSITTMAFFLPKPTVRTDQLVVQFGVSCRAGVFVVLTTNTKTTGYYSQVIGETGNPTSSIGLVPLYNVDELTLGVCGYTNRDTVGTPSFVGTQDVDLYNTSINSGGGANSLGMLVSGIRGPVSFGSIIWGFSSSSTMSGTGVSLKNSAFNAAGTLVIRHAPGV